jgi:hypothetical protein
MNIQMASKELSPTEIIMQDRTCQGGEAERVLNVIQHRLDQGNTLVIRKHNCLYLITRLGAGEAEGHFYGAESAWYTVKAVKYFIEQTRQAGIHTLYICDFTDPNMERMLNMINLTVQPSDKEGFEYMVNLARSM